MGRVYFKISKMKKRFIQYLIGPSPRECLELSRKNRVFQKEQKRIKNENICRLIEQCALMNINKK